MFILNRIYFATINIKPVYLLWIVLTSVKAFKIIQYFLEDPIMKKYDFKQVRGSKENVPVRKDCVFIQTIDYESSSVVVVSVSIVS